MNNTKRNLKYTATVKKFDCKDERKTTFINATKTFNMLKENRLVRSKDEDTEYLYYR